MASSLGSKIPQLIVGAAAISALGLSTIGTIRDSLSSAELQRALITTGDKYVMVTEDTTPQTFLGDDTTNPIIVDPALPGVPYCTGNTGALLCRVTIKLTGSGGHKAHNAGSFLCETSTCSIVDSRVFTEAVPLSDHLYGGWTKEPSTTSGAQLFNKVLAASGWTLIGSGSTVGSGLTAFNIEKDVPPGWTIKFTWHTGNNSEDYGRTKAAAVITYWKYWNP